MAFSAMALDDTHIYLLGEDGTVWRIARGTHQRSKLTTVKPLPRRGLLALDDSHLFVVATDGVWSSPGHLLSVSKTGGELTQVAATPTAVCGSCGLAVDRGRAFYWTDKRQGREDELVSVALATGESTVVDAGMGRRGVPPLGRDRSRAGGPAVVPPTGFDVQFHGDQVYWWNEEDDEPTGLLRMPRAGGTPEVVLNPPKGCSPEIDDAFAYGVAGDHVYWTCSSGELWRSSLVPDQTPAELLERRGGYDDDDYPPLLAIDDGVIYWQAGPNLNERRSDGEPLGLYYRCL